LYKQFTYKFIHSYKSHMSKWFYDTFTGTATRATYCDSLLERAYVSRMLALDERSGHQNLCGLDYRNVIPYVHRNIEVVLLKR
jgi:hypothetical protein